MNISRAPQQATFLERVAELGGKRAPFLRWSFVRMLLGVRKLTRDWQVGDGREQAAAEYVLATAAQGDMDAAIHAIDEFAYQRKYLINVGDEKGAILDAALERAKPQRVLELGAYVGYSALRIARKLPPRGHLYSIEFNPANAAIAQRIADHAGASSRISFVVGRLGDGGGTMERLRALGFGPGSLDLVFIDHDKHEYVADLERILAAGWLRTGALVVADNIGFPGVPAYRKFMTEQEGKLFRTQVHKTSTEYQTLIPDLVLVSERL